MKISARVFLPSILVVALTSGVLVSDATATSVQITFGGHVTGTGTGVSFPDGANGVPVAVGNSISGYFTYNTSQANNGTTGVYSFVSNPQTMIFSIPTDNDLSTFGGQNSITAPKDEYTIKITYSGKVATFDVSMDLINTYNKTGGTTCDLSFTSSTYTGYALPTLATFQADFTYNNGSFNWDPPPISGQGGGPGVGGVLNMIAGQMSAPEPSSLILMTTATAVGGTGLLISRRRRKPIARAS